MICQVLVAASVIIFVIGIDIEPKILNIDYQIHSNNDLQEFRQVLLKGARRFKFDPHYVSASVQCGDQKSCLLLNHDKPATQFSVYNTSTDLLAFVKGSEFADITEGDRVTIALCFKSAPDKCQNTTAFNNWLRLVDDFYLQAQSAPKQVEFILDGDAAPTQPCLLGRWEKWNSVWINSNSPAGAFYSNDQQDDYYRFQVLNNPESQTNWTWMASADVNYGKFSNGSYPYQLWEPDSQQDIRDYIDIYHSGSTHLPAGFHFAINVDVAMFRVYSSRYGLAHRPAHTMQAAAAAAAADSYRGRDRGGVQEAKSSRRPLPGCETSLSISQPLLDEESTTPALDTSPLLVALQPGYFLSATIRGSSAVALSLVEANRLAFTAATTSSITLSEEDSKWLLTFFSTTSTTSSALLVSALLLSGQDSDAPTLLLASSVGRLLLVTVSIKAGTLTVSSTAQGALPDTLASASLFDVTALAASSCATPGASLCTQVLTSASADQLAVSTVAIVSVDGDVQTSLEASASVDAPASGVITSARLAHLDQDSARQTLIFCAQELTVYAAEVTPASSLLAWSTVSVGKHLQLSVAGSGPAQALLLVTDSGYCYNSHGHNTRAYPTVCASTPVPTETVLDYSLGLARHWLEALRSGAAESVQDAQKKFIATSCSDKILHGSYDQGGHPAVSLTCSSVPAIAPVAPGAGESMYFFLEAHEGVPTSTTFSTASAAVVGTRGVRSRGGGDCGDPVHRDGVVLDAFAVDSWLRALQRVYPAAE